MPHNSSHDVRSRVRDERYSAYLRILAVTGPISYIELTQRMGGLVSCYDLVVRDMSRLLEAEEVLTLKKRGSLTLACCADYALEEFAGYAEYEIRGKRAHTSAMRSAARATALGIVVTELGPGHRKISFEHGWKSAGGQRFASHARCTSSAENIYA